MAADVLCCGWHAVTTTTFHDSTSLAALTSLASALAALTAGPTGPAVHRGDAQAAPRWRQKLADRMQ